MSKKHVVIIGVIAGLAVIAILVVIMVLSRHPSKEVSGISAPAATPQPAGQQEQKAEPASAPQETQLVEIGQDKQQLIGVKTAAADFRTMQAAIRTAGRIEYDERRIATANTKIEGWIERLYVDYTGKYVGKGEPLAEIYSPDLYATQQEYLHLLKWNARHSEKKNSIGSELLGSDSAALVEAARQRLKLWDISDEQIKKIEQNNAPIRTLTIYSPASGYVVQKQAVKGMRVMPGDKLFDIADLSTVWIIADIYEYEMPLVKVGQRALISLSYIPAKEYSAKVEFVYPGISADTRTSKIRLSLANPGGQLKPQMFTNVEIRIPLGSRLSVPQDAVIDTGTRKIVYVDRGEGYFEPREIVTGIKADGFIEVVKGLRKGEKVAAAANFLIDSEARLKGVVK
ncbi:MAG: efflux RND transporter periplasmic adaptor subunit [Nitrospiraceae bacterium]|nr:efflux RND transporter periplasmic adaptor subunit [Nitrospiraceae bacterium]